MPDEAVYCSKCASKLHFNDKVSYQCDEDDEELEQYQKARDEPTKMGYVIFGFIWIILWLPIFPTGDLLPESWEVPLILISIVNIIVGVVCILYGFRILRI